LLLPPTCFRNNCYKKYLKHIYKICNLQLLIECYIKGGSLRFQAVVKRLVFSEEIDLQINIIKKSFKIRQS